MDHGIFRFKWRSLHKISEQTYRSNQPFPWQILDDKNKRGIKTVINLRGVRNCSSFFLEKETCAKHNIKLINFPVTSRAAPKIETILAAKKLFNEIEAEVSGKIIKVLVDDSTPVEYDQPLFVVDPS